MPSEPHLPPHRGGVDRYRDVNVVAEFLARRDVATVDAAGADVLVLCGSAVLSTLDLTAQAFHEGRVPRILVTGGSGHSTRYLREAVARHPRYGDLPTAGRSEAAILADLLRHHHEVPDTAIDVEELSSNCSENARFSVDVLHRGPRRWRTILLVQDPTMQRRTHACFERSLRDDPDAVVRSYAPFVPVVTGGEVEDPAGNVVWTSQRFLELLLGEVRRLHDDEQGYGPRGAGFIDHVEVPAEVLSAYRRLAAAHPGSVRPAWRP